MPSRSRAFPPKLDTFPRLLGLSLTARLAVDTTAQLFSPFLSIFAAGMGMDPVALGRLISLRNATGLLAPVFGVLADRRSYRRVLQTSLFLTAAGLLTIGLGAGLWTILLGMFLMGAGFSGFIPTLQAYMSARLPYARRAQGLGMLEYSWALSGILGLYLAGQLIAAAGWRSPFLVLGGFLLLMIPAFGLLPSVRRSPGELARQAAQEAARQAAGDPPRPSLTARAQAFLDLGPNRRSAWAALMTSGLLIFSLLHTVIAHGVWLAREYGLEASELGTIALVAGVADLGGSVLVSLVTDRLGKRRSVLLGGLTCLVAYLLLPVLNVGLLPAVTGLAFMRFAFEFTIVSNLPLVSEQLPEQRGKLMSMSSTFGMGGATLAGLTGPWAYERFGVLGLGLGSAAAVALALGMVYFRVKEGG